MKKSFEEEGVVAMQPSFASLSADSFPREKESIGGGFHVEVK